MNVKNLALVVVIFFVATAAWHVLGETIVTRTSSAHYELGQDVERMFGPEIHQAAPVITPAAEEDAVRDPDGTDIACRFQHENRYRGLIWFSVFHVGFRATYTVHPSPAGKALFTMRLPQHANIDELVARAGDRDLAVADGMITGELDFAAGAPVEVVVSYVSTGQDSWRYAPHGKDLRNFRLTATTNFSAIDYPSDGLSPTERARDVEGGGKQAVWRYERLLPAQNRVIGIVMPARPSAGALAARISQFAPVSLFFFLTVMITIQLIRNLRLHPINYLLIAAGFFAFHILLGYLADHLTIHLAFWVSAAVSVFLVVSYLRLVLGMKTAILIAGAAQMVYLVFFSYAFFWQGWTGLTVVIGAITTLFLIMQLTGRIDWNTLFPDVARQARVETA
ncbi:MAG: inner membrane CreD family protein [Planctomycetota bacterium]|jgi:hypothetical protein